MNRRASLFPAPALPATAIQRTVAARPRSPAFLAALTLLVSVIGCGLSRRHGIAYAQQAGLIIVGYNNYTDSSGALHIVGEAQNATGAPISFARITATYRNLAGSVVGSEAGYTTIDSPLPDETVPFEILTLTPPAGLDHYDLTASFDRPAGTPLRDFQLRVDSVAINDIGSLHVIGSAGNGTGGSANFVKVVLAIFDENGTLLRTDFTYAADANTIPAGSAAPFDVFISDCPGYASYKLWVQGRAA